MLLTTCAACAAPLAHDAHRCVRCKTGYCNATCQHDHWRRGHKQICKKIHRGGNAEQYHADNKYKEAVAEAVEKCADDTKGQTCYICTEAVHWKTKEELVRGCSCRGTAGFVHVSCLAEQAKILVAEAEENNLEIQPKWERWHACSLCEQNYNGVVACALGWACWKCPVPLTEDVFNQPLGGWNVDKVTDMCLMFNGASGFNQSLGGWSVDKVTDMRGMFQGASGFNQSIGDWRVDKVTNMRGMFHPVKESCCAISQIRPRPPVRRPLRYFL